MTVFPVKPDGSVLLTAYAKFSLSDIAELKASTSYPNPCRNTQHTVATLEADGALALALNLSSACCATTFTTGTLPGNVSRDIIHVNVTRPDWPADFYVLISVSFAASEVTIEYEAEPTIQGAYNITYQCVINLQNHSSHSSGRRARHGFFAPHATTSADLATEPRLRST